MAPADLLDFLSRPASYPHRPESVDVIQTHASYVALAGPYVFKVKKPVDLGFLDFSTLEKRRHFCQEEVRLNRRLCARIYEGVVPIYLQDGRMRIGEIRGDARDPKVGQEGDHGESGEVVEYAVKMHRLQDGRFLTDLTTEDAYVELLDPVIDVLATFYLNQQPRPEVTYWGHADRFRISTDENFRQTWEFVGGLIPRPTYDAIRTYTERFVEINDRLFKRRCRDGYILDCHGDLRAEHIHLSSEGVCIYDCIEFNERFRYVDVANDVAFLSMDLDFLDRPLWARYVIDRIAERTDDLELSRLADFYKCYRAFVRGKVECMRAAEAEVSLSEREESRERARRYYQLALRYAVLGSAPSVIVVMGGVGTGKSTQARMLSALLGIEVFSSDRVRKELAGVPAYERGDEAARRQLYSGERTVETYAALQQHALSSAAQGRSVILDATFGRAAHRAQLREALCRSNVALHFIELHAPEETVQRRLERRSVSREEMSDARIEDYEMLQSQYEAPDSGEESEIIRISAEAGTDTTTTHVLNRLLCSHADV